VAVYLHVGLRKRTTKATTHTAATM
jgi:hypothetical protein